MGRQVAARPHDTVTFDGCRASKSCRSRRIPRSHSSKGSFGRNPHRTDRDNNLLLAVDLPLLTPNFLQVFHSRFLASGKHLLACKIAGGFPLCLAIRKDLTEEVERRVVTENLAIRTFIEESNKDLLEEDKLRRLGFDLAMFANINTPQDWERCTKRP